MVIEPPSPKREPRPQDNDGTYLCYHKPCTSEAGVATPRRIESTGYDPVESIVTFCIQCYLANEVLRWTRSPPGLRQDADDPDNKIPPEQLFPRLLAFYDLYDDPRGRDPPDEESPLNDIFEHAGEFGEEIRQKINMPVEEQLRQYDTIDGSETEILGEPTDLDEFSSSK